MSKIIFKILLFLLFNLNLFAGEFKYTYLELENYKINKSKEVEKNLTSYLGKIKFSSFVTIDSRKTIFKKQVESVKSLYLIDPNRQNETEEEQYVINSIEVKVIVYENVQSAFNKEINNIANSVFNGHKIKTIILYADSTRSYYELLNNTDGVTDFQGLIKSIITRHISEVMRLFGVLIFSIVAIFGVVIFARLLKGPLNSMSESLKNFSKNKNDSKLNEAKSGDVLNNDQNKYEEINLNFKHNLKIFELLIVDRSESIADVILESSINATGIKKTLPYIYNISLLTKLKEQLTNLHVLKLSESNFEFKNHQDYMIWFNMIVEKLSLAAVIESKNILINIESSKLERLKKIPLSILKRYIEEVQNPIAIQIVLDTITGDQKIRFIQTLNIEDWKLAVNVNDVTYDEVLENVESLLRFGEQSTPVGILATADKLSIDLVIPNLVNILKLKKLKDQDLFLEELGSVSPNIINKVRERFWTPFMIQTVPLVNLKEHLLRYTVEERVNILSVLPVNVSNYIIENAIEGKSKIIVQDLLSSGQNKDEALALKFLIELHEAFSKNEFELIKLQETSKKLMNEEIDESLVAEFDDLDEVDSADEDLVA